MHILSLPKPVSLGAQGSFGPGEFLVEDRNGAELMLRCPGATMQHELLRGRSALFPGDMSQRVLIIGTIGFGDALLLTPCLRHIKSIFPKASLHLASFAEYRQVFAGLPYIDGFEQYPLPSGRISDYDCIFTLERSVEDNPKAREQHMTDRFTEHLGFGEIPPDQRTPELHLTADETRWAKESFPRVEGRRRVGIQVQAGMRCRTYPGSHITLLANALVRDGWEVYLMGRPGEFVAKESPNIHNLARHGLTWRQSVAFLQTCDAFVGPDSSLLHAAGTLGRPAIGLFGAFPWKLRTAYYSSVFAIQGTEGCSAHPCFHSEHAGFPPFPQGQPCATSGRCEVLASILPERVLAKLNQIAPA